MTTSVFSVYDDKAQIFGTPFFMHNDAMAERAFKNLSTDETSSIYKNPADFKLYRMGKFNDQDGLLESEKIPVLICTAPLKLEKEE